MLIVPARHHNSLVCSNIVLRTRLMPETPCKIMLVSQVLITAT